MGATKKHFCAGPSCPGFFHKASDIAHPPSCARAPQHLPAVARFAEARHQLRLATSSLDAVLDNGESVWSAGELCRRVLEATAALEVITEVAEAVTDFRAYVPERDDEPYHELADPKETV